MPANFSRRLIGQQRSERGNRDLAVILTFVAGAMNAAGFLAVKQYTSHMTGMLSSIADNLILGAYPLVLSGVGAMFSFVMGAAFTAVAVNLARRRNLGSQYAFPLLVEACLILCFGLLGLKLVYIEGLFVSVTVMLLCFMMGLQNALITKISRAEIRTTHVTGMITDIGIELGKLLYWNSTAHVERDNVRADRKRLKLLSTLVVAFLLGGIVGAYGFNRLGYVAAVPFAVFLMLLASIPLADDWKSQSAR